MKIIKTFLFILLFILLISPFKVHAEPTQYKDLELKIYEFDFMDIMKRIMEAENVQNGVQVPVDFFALSFLVNNENVVREEEITIDQNTRQTNYYLIDGDKKIFSVIINIRAQSEDELIKTDLSIFDNYTVDDNFIYVLTDDDKEIIENMFNPSYGDGLVCEESLADYDRIIIKLSEADNTKDGVYINRVRLSEKTSTTSVITKPTVDGLNLDLDLQFKAVGDYAIYRVAVRNNTDKEYQISDDTIYGTDNYIKYEFSFEDSNNVLKPNTEKIMYVKASYDKEVPEEVFAAAPGGGSGFVETRKLEVALINETGDVGNPNTGDNIMTSILVIMISVALIIVMIKVQALRKAMMIVLAGVILIPVVANAIERLNVTINAKIEIKNLHRKFCVYTDNNRTEKEYYDYIDGMTWNDYYNANSDSPLLYDYSHLEIDFYHYNHGTCEPESSPNPYTSNNNTYGFDILGGSIPNGKWIDCDGHEYMEKTDQIESSEEGCYVLEVRYYT